MKTRATLAAAAVTAAAVSACASTVPGAPLAAPIGTRPPATAPAAPAKHPAAPRRVDIGPGPAPADWLEPGAAVFDAAGGSCTLGPALSGDAIATAGHCGSAGDLFFNPSGAETGAIEKSVVDPLITGHAPLAGDARPVLDFATIRLDAPLHSAVPVRIAGLPVTGVLTEKAVKALPLRTTLMCFLGTKSGRQCGPLIDADHLFVDADHPDVYTNARYIKINVTSVDGDSGAPVFLVDGPTRTVTLVGLLTGGDPLDGSTYATYLDADLAAAQTKVLVDADAARAVAGNPDYSTLVSPR